ncbi:hypothetical protein HNY73_021259 [Argiope bruennichi]|uniref:Uncharacterized protein n=1 Tax=Argiope bruennichi TaxID=94029 RepID=A0A8T0EAE1_ARGBR|nr:hypothetical protein HNY73_021259 [Argiope bruennichi]
MTTVGRMNMATRGSTPAWFGSGHAWSRNGIQGGGNETSSLPSRKNLVQGLAESDKRKEKLLQMHKSGPSFLEICLRDFYLVPLWTIYIHNRFATGVPKTVSNYPRFVLGYLLYLMEYEPARQNAPGGSYLDAPSAFRRSLTDAVQRRMQDANRSFERKDFQKASQLFNRKRGLFWEELRNFAPCRSDVGKMSSCLSQDQFLIVINIGLVIALFPDIDLGSDYW